MNYEQLQGEGNVRTLYSGGLFTLSNYPREDQNREYLVISASYQYNRANMNQARVVGKMTSTHAASLPSVVIHHIEQNALHLNLLFRGHKLQLWLVLQGRRFGLMNLVA